MTVQELLTAAQQLSVSEQIRLANEIKRLAEQTLSFSSELAEEKDPIVGLFDGSPNLATDAKSILAKEVTSGSGFTCKKS